jgi:hypothetical protein
MVQLGIEFPNIVSKFAHVSKIAVPLGQDKSSQTGVNIRIQNKSPRTFTGRPSNLQVNVHINENLS